jgi:hypothetical protein
MFYTKSWTRRQQRRFGSKDSLIVEKILDLVNIGVGSLFFGQFLSQQINIAVFVLTGFIALLLYFLIWYNLNTI